MHCIIDTAISCENILSWCSRVDVCSTVQIALVSGPRLSIDYNLFLLSLLHTDFLDQCQFFKELLLVVDGVLFVNFGSWSCFPDNFVLAFYLKVINFGSFMLTKNLLQLVLVLGL